MNPQTIAPGEFFCQMLMEGKLMLQQCEQTGKHFFYPRVLSPFSGTDAWIWTEASGRGVVYSTTAIRRKPASGGDYNLALVELEEGPRMMSRVENIDPADVYIGMPVIASIDTSNAEEPLVFFRPDQVADATQGAE